jgi:hypothetical protein
MRKELRPARKCAGLSIRKTSPTRDSRRPVKTAQRYKSDGVPAVIARAMMHTMAAGL